MSTAVLTAPPCPPWLISKRDDLLWFVGGSFLGYGLFAVAATLGWMPGPAVIIWSLLLNAPHIFSTATRVVFDSSERKKIGWSWLMLLPLLALGPALDLAVAPRSSYVLILLWGHYHISKQHMGFVMLYRAKARERSDATRDKRFALASLMLPLAYYGFAALVANGRLVLVGFVAVGVGLAIRYVAAEIGQPEHNWPKLLLLAVTIPLNWAAFIYAAQTLSLERLAIAGMVTNIGHSFQYLRLMRFHNQNRYAQSTGLLKMINRSAPSFFLAAFLLALPSHVLPALGPIAVGSVLGFTLFHYFVDAQIWRVRGDKELAAALRLS